MTVLDILIIYLAFGAPIAVYKYLQNRDARFVLRCLIAAGTFLFWIPAAVRIGHLYISNAYFGDGFVSPVDSDSSEMFISEVREDLRGELVRLGVGIGMHDVRETVDRYVGLASATRGTVFGGAVHENLFKAAGRKGSGVEIHCMNIRNRRRLERHHNQSRKEFLKLLADIPSLSESAPAMKLALKLARQLNDPNTFEELRKLITDKAEVWNPETTQQTQSLSVASVIAATGSLNSD